MKEKKKVILTCSVCLSRNYTTNKNSNAKRIELMKYCPKCNQHTLHKETK
ncbi:MAG: 50S ribosomal protein L33 [Erysipelotrichaceae bacterium]|nr:50S ribosomal protein L33 [Erysipelotrichaceae bacterium]